MLRYIFLQHDPIWVMFFYETLSINISLIADQMKPLDGMILIKTFTHHFELPRVYVVVRKVKVDQVLIF